MTKRAPFEKLPGQIDLEEAIAAKDGHVESSSYHGGFYDPQDPFTPSKTVYASEADPETLARAAEPLLAERGSSHGPWEDNSWFIQSIKEIVRTNPTRGEPLRPVHQEALEMFAVKMGRILAGDPDCKDHWDDIAGYAKLASAHCKEK